MAGKVCLFTKCHGPSKWKPHGTVTEKAVTYSELLGQKRGFQQFINFNDIQISKSGKIDSYCIVDKMFKPSKGSNIEIFIFDEEYQGTLYLQYSVHQQRVIKNCNDLITFLSFHKNSIFHLHNSFIYVKSTDRFKWDLYFSVLEFLMKNLNTSVIGSQFYLPLFSKYLIMNELRLLLILQNQLASANTNFKKTFSQACAVSKLRVKKILSSRASYTHSVAILQNPKNNSFPSEQPGKKTDKLSTDACKSSQTMQLKRKSTDLCFEDDCMPKTKRFVSKNKCHCKNYSWEIFASFKIDAILNYTSILEAKKWVDEPEAMDISTIDCEFQTDCMQYSSSLTLHQNESRLNQDVPISINNSKKTSPLQLLDKISDAKNITCLSLKEKEKSSQSKYKHTSDFQTLKEMKSISDNKGYTTLDGFNNLPPLTLEHKTEESNLKGTITGESQNNIAGPSGQMALKTGHLGINKPSVSFQTAAGTSLKISEAALRAAEKMFMEISSENLNIFPQKKTPNSAAQVKSIVSDKHFVGFQTASGKSLQASKAALEAAETMFKMISVEETDIFPEKLTPSKRNSKECYPSVKECVDEDISKDLAENFFEDIPFDEKEMDSKPTNDSEVLSVHKSEITKTTHTKKRKSLGGRRSLKPYTLKK